MTGRWIACCACKEPIYMDALHETALSRSGQNWHCLWGHPQHFTPGKTLLEKMTEERDELKRRANRLFQEQARLIEEREAADRRTAAAKGRVTRLKNRAAAGVCPCCNRTFQQLARHMAAKHPTFTTAPDAMQ